MAEVKASIKPEEELVDIVVIASEQSSIPMYYHEAFWRHKRWIQGKMVTRTEYRDEFIRFKEVY